MLRISKKVGPSQCLKSLSSVYRTVYSGRVPQFLSNAALKNSDNDGCKKDGYGEKEIFLLGPADVRTPLPGNTGIPPISLFCMNQIKELPKPAGEKCDVTADPLPEERYQNLLTQIACISAKDAILTPCKLECIAHSCPQLLKKDFLDLFPNRNLNDDEFTVITLCQKTKNNMSEWSEGAEKERENLECYFITAANAICDHLKNFEYWADFIHPNSGKPYFHSLTNSTMFETDLRYRHFGFNIEDLGCCRIISHNIWGTHIFVGAIFTNAPLDSSEVQSILNKQGTKIFDWNSSEN